MTTQLESRMRLLLLLTLVALLALASAPAVLADDDDDDGGGSTRAAANRCVVKFVCGDLEESVDRAVGGDYRTSINILNAGTNAVNYTKKLSLTTPCDDEVFETPGDILPVPPLSPLSGSLGSMSAFDVDCDEIFDEFLAGAECDDGAGLDFVEGFLILESDKPLDVTAVYTAGNTISLGELGEQDGVSSIDVESVKCTQSSSKSDDDDD